MSADDDPSSAVVPETKPASSVLRRPAANVADAQAARTAQAAKIEQLQERANAVPLTAKSLITGDVVWVVIKNAEIQGGEQAKCRPWLIISHGGRTHRDDLNMVIAVPLSRKVDKAGKFRCARIAVPPELLTSTDARFEKSPCIALTEHVRAIAVERIECKVGEIDRSVVHACQGAVGYLIGL